MNYIFVPLQNTVNKKQLEETLALIFFVQLSLNLRNSTVTSYDFFYFTVAAKLCLSILPKVDLHMQSSSFFLRLPKHARQTGTVVVFGVFSLAEWISAIYAIATSRRRYFSLLFILTKLFLVFMCVSKICNSNYGVWVCVCVCVCVCVFQRSCFVPISSLSTFLWF